MNNRKKTWYGIIFGITLAIIFILQDYLRHDDLNTKNIIMVFVSSLIGGAIGGILFGWILRVWTNSRVLLKGTPITIDASEIIVFTTGANHFQGVEGVGGKLYLTNKRLIFKSHNFNIQNHEFSIRLSEVDKVKRYHTFGVVNNGLLITTIHNSIEKFVVQEPEEWMNQLSEINSDEQVPA